MDARALRSVFPMLLGILLSVSGLAASSEDAAPQPRLDVVLQQDWLARNDTAPLSVFIQNSSPHPLTGVELSFDGPAFLQVEEGVCNKSKGGALPVRIGTVPPNSGIHRSLCLRTRSKIVEGTFSLTFILRYGGQWAAPGSVSYLTQERKITASLFGVESVAGVSLSLLVYLLPGLIALLIFRILDLKVLGRLSNTEVMLLAVFISLFMVFLSPFGREISVVRLFELCFASATISILLSVGLLWNKLQEKRRLDLVIQAGDDELFSLEKALRAREAGSTGPFRVMTTSNVELVGSTYGATPDGIALFGWYKVSSNRTDQKRLQLWQQEKDWVRIVNLARSQGLKMELADPVRQFDGQPAGVFGGRYFILGKEIREGPVPLDSSEFPSAPIRLQGIQAP